MAGTILDDKLHWYKDAIIYELHIKAFRDGNGDGIGDFAGLLEKLDYLQELGVTAIWVLPFYPSPLRDDGYDIADYYTINPRYGTLEQFQQFLDEAHKRGLKVITELVINHTSDQHPWFQRARTAPKGSPERDFYVWTDDPSQYKDVRIIFQDFEASNWTWDPIAQQYYWHRFFHHQPDLNYDNPAVQEEIFKIIDYWCAMGVDGFRLDAVPYLYEREGTNGENLPETHAFLKKLRKHIDEHFPGTVFLAEANMWPEDSASYFGNGDECHMNYHFPVMPRMFMSLQQEDRYPITDIFDQTPEIPETCQWAMFLRNHDELTLEMVTDEERDFMYKVYAKDPKAKINLGIRHRLAPLMDGNRRKIELMNSLLFSLPGTPVIYYGDEIGMGDNFYLGDRDGVRTPMQWSADRNAGFSEANPHQLYLPLILDPEYHYEAVNVELQRRNTSSLFWYMKRIINMRKAFKAFGRGDMKFLGVENPKVLAFTRSYEDQTLLIIVNLSKYSQPAEVDLSAYKGYLPVEVFSKNRFPAIKEESPYFFTLGPHSYQWFQLEKTASLAEESRKLTSLSLLDWNNLAKPPFSQQLETDVLPEYISSRSWFAGQARTIYNVLISDSFPLPVEKGTVFFLLVDVVYESGLPETYQLPLTFVGADAVQQLQRTCPEAIVANMNLKGEDGMLCDAFYLAPLQQALFQLLIKGETLSFAGRNLRFECFNLKQTPEGIPQARIHEGSRHTTSILYDNACFLKMYRKVESFVNPDVELTRFLSEDAGYRYTPAFKGAIEWNTAKGNMALGMMQELVENHGHGYVFMQERVANFIERILARNTESLKELLTPAGTLAQPVGFDELPVSLQEVIGGRAAEQARLLGIRTGELHKALAEKAYEKEFVPEEFSLHYQRSLFSAMQSLVREAFQRLQRQSANLPDWVKANDSTSLEGTRERLLNLFKRIYEKKLDILKIRNHGNLVLKNVLLTSTDLFINDFGGNATKAFSERRLKRSPARDLAQMLCDIYYVVYEGFYTSSHIPEGDLSRYLPYLEQWATYIGGFFLRAYFETVQGSAFLPKNEKDRQMVMEVFLLERAFKHLNLDLAVASYRAVVPLRIIKRVLDKQQNQ